MWTLLIFKCGLKRSTSAGHTKMSMKNFLSFVKRKAVTLGTSQHHKNPQKRRATDSSFDPEHFGD
jgi:hypothetical protein